MIKVLMFDLGDTLVDSARRPFAHVPAALSAIAQLKTAAGRPLRSCLVSDVTLAAAPGARAKTAALFAEYLALLDATGLRPFFEPAAKRITLSTHAGAMKPARAVFEKALKRLGVAATLDECLLVTENAAHVRAARSSLHMAALRFRPPGASVGDAGDFDDWADAPALIAHRVAPGDAGNLQALVKAHLAAQGVELDAARAAPVGDAVDAAGHVWCAVSVPGCPDLDGLHVALPVTSRVGRDARGRLASAAVAAPSAGELAEAASFVQSLAAHGQIGGRALAGAARPTHQIEADAQGVKRLVRSRFSAR